VPGLFGEDENTVVSSTTLIGPVVLAELQLTEVKQELLPAVISQLGAFIFAVGVTAGLTTTSTSSTPLDTPEFQHSIRYVASTAGATASTSVPVNVFQPDQSPEAQQESAVPVTVQVRSDESPAVIVEGELVKVIVGATIGTALTDISISSETVAPSSSVAVNR
jgi:hypothetical protein